MTTFEQLAPAHARIIHDFIFIRTRINVKPFFAGWDNICFSPLGGSIGPTLLSLLDKRNAAVNYSDSR